MLLPEDGCANDDLSAESSASTLALDTLRWDGDAVAWDDDDRAERGEWHLRTVFPTENNRRVRVAPSVRKNGALDARRGS